MKQNWNKDTIIKRNWIKASLAVLSVIWLSALILLVRQNNTPANEAVLPTLVSIQDVAQAEGALNSIVLPTAAPNEPTETITTLSTETSITPTTEAATQLPSATPLPTQTEVQAPVVEPTLSRVTRPPVISAPPVEPVPNVAVLRLEPSQLGQLQADVVARGGTVEIVNATLGAVTVQMPSESAVQVLAQAEYVQASEPDYYVVSQASATDPRISEQWALSAMNIPLSLPDDLPEVTVAVIDSGICADNPELAGKILGGYDFIEGDATPQDEMGHGCAVAGIIAANWDGQGMAGIAPHARLLVYRVLNAQGSGRYSSVASAIVRAVDEGAQIINLSLGGVNPSQLLQDAVNYATSRNVLVIAAAGNNGRSTVLYPAAYANVVSVGATNPDGTPASFSNTGKVELWAPGVDILSLSLMGDYARMSGTSFAAPNVAGLAALEMAQGRELALGGTAGYGGNSEVVIIVPPSESTIEQYEESLIIEAKKTISEALGAEVDDIVISELKIEGIWGFGIGLKPAVEDGAPEMLLFIGKWENQWQVTTEYKELYAAWLPLLPQSLVPANYIEIYQEISAQGVNEHQLSLPWATGETWAFTSGPHSNDGSGSRPWSSLDFAGGSGIVRAAADGIAWRPCANFVRVDHANGWQTGYYHLINEHVYNGQSVSRGTALGQISTAVGCGGSSFGAHVHFSLRRNGSHVDIHNTDIGGWTVAETSHYSGTMTRIRDGLVRVSRTGPRDIYNEGAIGSGTYPPAPPTPTSSPMAHLTTRLVGINPVA